MTTIQVDKDLELQKTNFKDEWELILELIKLYKDPDIVSLVWSISDLEHDEKNKYIDYSFKTKVS